MKKLFLGLTLFSALLFAEVSSAQTQIDASELSTEFVQIEEQDGLVFSVSRQECVVIEGQKPVVYLFVQIENTTNEEVTVDFNIALQYAEACSGCDYSSEHRSSITIGAGETVTGDCSFESQGTSRVIYNPNYKGGWQFEGVKIMFIELNS